ncbi:MAG TPA: glycoside hydrolase family 2 TIM barrel-domain containing protein [Flavisolibacter sp.]|jgi:beta-glucuronidase|nr:glycoside hydrolase family 2 TIM barrel-domain containing protein [Flavisolibacter sp.]
MRNYFFFLFFFCSLETFSQQPLITDLPSRKTQSLNGKWQYIIDPYETGFRNYRWDERAQNDPEAYWSTDIPANKTDRKEHGYIDKYSLNVPGDWNSQDAKFLYYEGTVWYKKSFDADLPKENEKMFLYFGAVNYRADVYLNGKKLGMHVGGFTPFNFEIPAGVLKSKDNYLVVKVDNKRFADEIPTLNTDWWNYGGITRDVNLVTVPKNFILDYSLQLQKGSATAKDKTIDGWVKFNAPVSEDVTIEIPELKLKKKLTVNGDSASFNFKLSKLQLWSPETPRLYQAVISSKDDRIDDKIGFRTVEVQGKQILLNGKPIFLRGICIHEEIPQQGRRANSKRDALQLLGEAKELNCNMVRLAHYPHNENMTRTADSLGILVWSEIPVYWTIQFTNDTVLEKAKVQLNEMITRDHNRASIIIWSVGNETPVNAARTKFMSTLVQTAKQWDHTRLISAALETHTVNGVIAIDDPLGEFTDIVSVNEYLGWYGGLPSNCRTAKWDVKYSKPLFFSETGAEALGGFHGDSLTRWSEEYQEWYYKEQVEMMKRMPDNYVGMSPWILNDFRSPRRANPVYQEGWNNKGLFDHQLNKKKAFYILKKYYDEIQMKNL